MIFLFHSWGMLASPKKHVLIRFVHVLIRCWCIFWKGTASKRWEGVCKWCSFAFGALHRDIRVRAVGCSWSDRRNDGTFLLLTINIWASIFTVLSLCLQTRSIWFLLFMHSYGKINESEHSMLDDWMSHFSMSQRDDLEFVSVYFRSLRPALVNIAMGKLVDIVGFQNGEFQGADILIV